MKNISKISLCGFYNGSCGYCGGEGEPSASYGFRSEVMKSEDYKGSLILSSIFY